MEELSAILSLSALAHPGRLRLFRALVAAMPEGLTPGTLGPLLDIPPSTLSFHLKELSHAALIEAERDGRSLIYRPRLAHMNALLDYLTAHCCEASPAATGCSPAPARQGAACAPDTACCPPAVAPARKATRPSTRAAATAAAAPTPAHPRKTRSPK